MEDLHPEPHSPVLHCAAWGRLLQMRPWRHLQRQLGKSTDWKGKSFWHLKSKSSEFASSGEPSHSPGRLLWIRRCRQTDRHTHAWARANTEMTFKYFHPLMLPWHREHTQSWGHMGGWQLVAKYPALCDLCPLTDSLQCILWQPCRRNGSAMGLHTEHRQWCYMSKVIQNISSSSLLHIKKFPPTPAAKSGCFYPPWHNSWAATALLTSEVLLILHQLRISFLAFQACLPHPYLFYSSCLRAGGTEPRSRVQKKPQMGRVFIELFTLQITGKF